MRAAASGAPLRIDDLLTDEFRRDIKISSVDRSIVKCQHDLLILHEPGIWRFQVLSLCERPEFGVMRQL
jgi:hypothetical protein